MVDLPLMVSPLRQFLHADWSTSHPLVYHHRLFIHCGHPYYFLFRCLLLPPSSPRDLSSSFCASCLSWFSSFSFWVSFTGCHLRSLVPRRRRALQTPHIRIHHYLQTMASFSFSSFIHFLTCQIAPLTMTTMHLVSPEARVLALWAHLFH